MKKPWQHNGTTGFTQPDGTYQPTGSMMGRQSILPERGTGEWLQVRKVRLERLRLVDGAYDQGGAYWGGPETLWCAWNRAGDVEIYVRADDRETAKAKVRTLLPAAAFYR